MSNVFLVITKNNKVFSGHVHYTLALEMLAEPNCCAAWLDSGYIVVDFDNKLILSSQDCVSSHHLPADVRDFRWLQV